MRKILGIAGTVGGIGVFVLRYAIDFSNILGLFQLPADVRDALMALSGIPTAIAWVGVMLGLFCAGYLVFDSGHHKFVVAAIPRRARKMDTPQLTAVIGLAIIVVGVVVVGLGIWERLNQPIEVRSFGFATAAPAPPLVDPQLLPDDGGPIKWNRGFLLSASRNPGGMTIGGIQATGQNESDEFQGPISGFIRSEITGTQVAFKVDSDKGEEVSLDGYGVPARNQFRIFAPFGVQLSTADFIRDFGRMTFVFQYGDHVYKKYFTPDELEKELERTAVFLVPKPQVNKVGARRMPTKDSR